LQGVRIPSATLKIVFRHIIYFLFLMQFRLWRAGAFVSSPIYLLAYKCQTIQPRKRWICKPENIFHLIK